MMTKRAEGEMQTKLIIVVGIVAAIMIIGIGSHTALAIKVSKTSFQDGYNAGFEAGRKDRINGNEFDSKPPKGHSDAYDEGYKRGYDDGWSREEHVDSSSAAAASSSAAAGDGGDDGHKHRHRDSAAASSSSSAAADGDDGHHKDSAAASSSSSASS